MKTTKKKPIYISIDENLKKDADQLFDELGMDMTTAITIFLKQSVISVAKNGSVFTLLHRSIHYTVHPQIFEPLYVESCVW